MARVMTDLRIVDPCTPRSYDTTKSLQGLGGTEATILRIAGALATEARIVIEQAVRTNACRIGDLHFRSMDLEPQGGRVIVVINAWKVALKLRRANPTARILLWLHIYPGRHNRQMGARLRDADIGVICVSASHAQALHDFLPDPPRIGHIYNPIADDLHPDDTPRKANRLIFASSPHKGLAQVLDLFTHVRKAMPEMKLVLANPGYMRWPMPVLPEGILLRGSLDHDAVIAEFRRALCLFYSQNQFAETFGLVIAEANAVGCPALLHGDTGANREIACSPEQCLEKIDPETVIAQLTSWRSCAPRVQARPDFRLSSVVAVWRNLILGENASLPGEIGATRAIRERGVA